MLRLHGEVLPWLKVGKGADAEDRQSVAGMQTGRMNLIEPRRPPLKPRKTTTNTSWGMNDSS